MRLAGKMHLQVIVGSIRQGCVSLPVAKWVHGIAKSRSDLSVELVDLKAVALPMYELAKPPAMGEYEDAQQIEWAKIIARADGYIFVSPEYNHGYTSALKNALDYIYAEWGRKPASFVSFGNVMGARGIEQLRLVLIELRMAPLTSALHLQDIHGRIGSDGFQGSEKEVERLGRTIEDLIWWMNALGAARAADAADGGDNGAR
jgi:NAD(P)H-dependent FMN reductase